MILWQLADAAHKVANQSRKVGGLAGTGLKYLIKGLLQHGNIFQIQSQIFSSVALKTSH